MQFNDIRQRLGSKNIMIPCGIDGGSMSGDSKAAYIPTSEVENFLLHRRQAYYYWVVFHELFGHGTGKLLAESEPGKFNFDINQPPINPLTQERVNTWYKAGQTWASVFGDIATTVDECRAECVGAILIGNKDLMAMCGFTEETEVRASDREYFSYLYFCSWDHLPAYQLNTLFICC